LLETGLSRSPSRLASTLSSSSSNAIFTTCGIFLTTFQISPLRSKHAQACRGWHLGSVAWKFEILMYFTLVYLRCVNFLVLPSCNKWMSKIQRADCSSWCYRSIKKPQTILKWGWNGSTASIARHMTDMSIVIGPCWPFLNSCNFPSRIYMSDGGFGRTLT
jgi:hypothetical protein